MYKEHYNVNYIENPNQPGKKETDSIEDFTLIDYFHNKNFKNKGLTFIHSMEEETTISYSDLYKKALSILGSFQESGIKKGQEMVFQLENNEHFIYVFWACIMGGIIPVPVNLATDHDSGLKVKNIWECLQNPHLIISKKNFTNIKLFVATEASSIEPMVIFTEDIIDTTLYGKIASIQPNDIAFIQFSSGSTGNPKGVVLTHENLLTNIASIIDSTKATSQDSSLSWMPLTHDMGLIGFHLAPLANKTDQYIISIKQFITNPTIWLIKASQHKTSILASPNAGLQYFLKQYVPNKNLDIDLSSVRLILNGAEPISVKTIHEFQTAMEPCGLRENTMFPAYGLAEACLAVTLPPIGEELKIVHLKRSFLGVGEQVEYTNNTDNQSIAFVDLGFPVKNTQVRIINYDNHVLPENIVGRVQIHGKNVTAAYYRNQEATKQTISKDGWLQTGDLGFIKNKRIIITGREKDIIFSNGKNFYAHDIENVIHDCFPVKVVACGSFSEKTGKDEVLIFVKHKKNQETFIEFVSQIKKITYEKTGLKIDHVIPIERIPKTTSGKVQRYKLGFNYNQGVYAKIISEIGKKIGGKNNEKHVAPKNEIEKKLVNIWESVIPIRPISTTKNFFELGGDSIALIEIISKVEGEFRLEVTSNSFLKANTIEKLAFFISQRHHEKISLKYPKITPDNNNLHKPFPLTSVQLAYLMGRNSEFELGGVSAHGYYEIETKLDMDRFNRAFQKVIRRHPMLRAIVLPDGTQKIMQDVPEYKITIEDIHHYQSKECQKRILLERKRMSHHVFEADKWPLFECKAFKVSEGTHYLFIGLDLLIVDGLSIQILLKEIMAYYQNPECQLPELKFSFRDYVLACEKLKKTDFYERSKTYWLDKLHDFPTSPSLPFKTNPRKILRPHFKRKQQHYSSDQWNTLKRIAKKHAITPSALLCTVYGQILSLWGNQEQIAINLTVFNRYPFDKEVNNIIGDFTSVVLLEMANTTESSFWEKAKMLQQTLFTALEHRHYDGIDFIREFSRHHNLRSKAVFPYVFTSMLFNSEKESQGLQSLGDIKTGISQTPQVFTDLQVTEVNGGLTLTLDYVEELFEESTITKMFHQYMEGLDALLTNKANIEINIPQKDQLFINQYNDTDVNISPTTLQSLFQKQVKQTPDAIAVKKDREQFTYRELDAKSNQVARYLREHNIGRKDFVGVHGERNIWTMVNIMGILKTGAAYVPIEPDYPDERKDYITSNSNISIVLDPGFYQDNNLVQYATNTMDTNHHPDDIAYIIYTSGSTGKPKGVVITHKAVTNTIIDINQKFNITKKDRIIGLSSLCFDLSVYDMFGAFSSGAALILIDDVRDIPGIAEIVRKEKITVWNSVPAIMDLFVSHMRTISAKTNTFEIFKDLRLVMLSGDWISLQLPQSIKQLFCNAEVISLGGATECSIWSIYYPIDKIKKEWKSIPYGRPLANQRFYVLDHAMEHCPVGVQGELYIGGTGVAAGYLNDEKKTTEAFVRHPKLGGIYKTGDYGVYHNKGYIEFLGRKDNQIKIRGFRVELGEVEAVLREHAAIKDSVVILSQNTKNLVAYVVPSTDLSTEELNVYAKNKLPDYMVPKTYISLDKIPLTSNGKVNRKALPEPLIKTRTIKSKPADHLEKKLITIWEKTFELENIGLHDNFFDLGGDSIVMLYLVNQISTVFQIDLNYKEFLKAETISNVAKLISTKEIKKNKITYPQIRPDEANLYQPFPLTDIQMAYFVGRNMIFELGGISTHSYFEVETTLNINRLNDSLKKVIKQQPMLRAIILPNGSQQILKEVPQYRIHMEDLSMLDKKSQEETIVKERNRMSHHIFQPDKWPLFEFKAFKLSQKTNYLCVGFDLLLVDGTSMHILLKEILDFYHNPDLKINSLDFSFRDYVTAYKALKTTDFYLRDKKYWLEKLDNLPLAPSLPLKKSPKNVKNPRFKRHQKIYSKNDWDKIKKKAKENHITPSSLLCTAYAEILALWSNQSELSINMTLFNRYPFHESVNTLIGDFTGIAVLSMNLEEKQYFWERAGKVQETLMEAIEHRHYDGIEFLREYSKHHNLGTKAVMPVVFTSMLFSRKEHEFLETDRDWGKFKMGVSQTSQVYLDYQAMERNGELHVIWDYVEDLFDEATINSMFEQYTQVVESLAKSNSHYKVQISKNDFANIMDYNDTDEDIPLTTLHGIFKNQVRLTPDNVAIKKDNITLTYGQLNQKTNQIARRLKEKGIGRGDYVGVLAKKDPMTIANILGILATGAAYVPIEPSYPKKRQNYMLNHSQCKLFIDENFYKNNNAANCSKDTFKGEYHSEDVAYIMYTSGSTGNPKGVVITHQAVSNTVIDINRKFNVSAQDRIIGLSSLCFDLSVFDIFGSLSTGARLVMIDEVRDISKVWEIMSREKITIWNSVPAIMDLLTEHLLKGKKLPWDQNSSQSLRLVMLSGDWIPLPLPEKICSCFPNAETISLGGATEASIWSIYYPIRNVSKKWRSIPYGFPLSNQGVYVLNHELAHCPVGVEGELYIGGIGVASGYLNDEEKTRSAFLHHSELGYLYKTGDYGKYHMEGYVEFLGRKDHQIKIRGYRIELGEIESALLTYPGIKNVIVTDYDDYNSKYLCSFVVSDRKIKVNELKKYIAQELPDYMVPKHIIQIDSVPLTSSGKIDRKALPRPNIEIQYEKICLKPGNEVEQKLLDLWITNFEIEQIGIDESFIDIGMDSISIINAMVAIKNEFNVTLEFNDFLHANTIQKLAGLILEKVYNKKTTIQNNGVIKLSNVSSPKAVLLCFPYACGSPFMFSSFSQYIDENIEVLSVQYPEGQKSPACIEDVTRCYLPELNKLDDTIPIYIFGYSFGAVVAFDMLRNLYGKKNIGGIIFAGASPEYSLTNSEITMIKDKKGLWQEVYQNNTCKLNTDFTIFNDEQKESFATLFGESLQAMHNYTFETIQFEIPCLVSTGEQEDKQIADKVHLWRPFFKDVMFRETKGDHYFINEYPDIMAEMVMEFIENHEEVNA